MNNRTESASRWLFTLSLLGCSPDAMSGDAGTDGAVQRDVPTGMDVMSALDVPTMPGTDVPSAVDVPSSTDVPSLADRPGMPVDTFVPPVDGAMVGAYPAAPYGTNMGDTLENLGFQGHLVSDGAQLSASRPFDSMLNMQRVRETGRRYALVHTSAAY